MSTCAYRHGFVRSRKRKRKHTRRREILMVQHVCVRFSVQHRCSSSTMRFIYLDCLPEPVCVCFRDHPLPTHACESTECMLGLVRHGKFTEYMRVCAQHTLEHTHAHTLTHIAFGGKAWISESVCVWPPCVRGDKMLHMGRRSRTDADGGGNGWGGWNKM